MLKAILKFLHLVLTLWWLNMNMVWNRTYSDELNVPDPALNLAFRFSTTAADNATAKLAHILIEQLKKDLQGSYASIIDSLEQ